MDVTTALVPIFICVVLPVAIVLIFALASINKDNKQSMVLIKAIEANNNIDADKLAEAMRKPKKTPRERLNLRLQHGCVFSSLGVALLILGLTGIIPSYRDFELFVLYLAATVCLSVGIGYLITWFITRDTVDK